MSLSWKWSVYLVVRLKLVLNSDNELIEFLWNNVQEGS